MSVLLPTSTMIASLPLSARTSSTHFEIWLNELRSGKLGDLREEKQTFLTGDIIDNDSDARVANVGGNERAETLLACSVPQLQTHLRKACNFIWKLIKRSFLQWNYEPFCPRGTSSWRGSRCQSWPGRSSRTSRTWSAWWSRFCPLEEISFLSKTTEDAPQCNTKKLYIANSLRFGLLIPTFLDYPFSFSPTSILYPLLKWVVQAWNFSTIIAARLQLQNLKKPNLG